MVNILGYILLLTILLTNLKATAQQTNKLDINSGYGYYEAAFVGIRYNASPDNHWLLGAGYNFNADNISYKSVFCAFQKSLFKPKQTDIQLGAGMQLTYWKQSDQYLVWDNLGVYPNVFGEYKLNKKLSLLSSLGPQWNFNVSNKRKTYEKSGWVKKIDLNFQLWLSYAL